MSTPNLGWPVSPPPPGTSSNFTNPPNHAILAYSTNIISLILITFFTWSRFAVKICLVRSMHLEDYLIPFAWLFGVGHNVAAFLGYNLAPIVHSWDMQLSTYSRYSLYASVGASFYNISIALIKVSMLIQVLRIFVPHGSPSKTYYVIHGIIWTTIPFHFIMAFLMIFNCHPMKKSWEPWISGKCLPMGAIAMSIASMNLISDIFILVVTQRVIWGMMKVDKKQRLRLGFVFSIGIIPCGFAILCLIYNTRMLHSHDFVWDASIMALACHAEITSGLFVLWMPIVPRFFTYLKDCNITKPFLKRFHSLRSWPSVHRRGPSKLEYADRGLPKGAAFRGGDLSKRAKVEKNNRSMWHISYTQKGGVNGKGEAVWRLSEEFDSEKSFEEDLEKDFRFQSFHKA